jgi:hypothetical protein
MAAIARLTLCEAARTGTTGSLGIVLLATLVWMAVAIEGDGTPAGRIEVFLRYAFGVTTGILTLATLWLAAGRIASERDDRTLQLMAVKPVRRSEILLGKWMGLLALNALLLAACAATIWVCTEAALRRAVPDAHARARVRERMLVPRLAVEPKADSLDAEARTVYDRATAEPGGVAEPFDDFLRRFEAARNTVPPGGMRQWAFRMPAGFRPGHSLWLRTSFSYASVERYPMAGTWSLLSGATTSVLWSASVSNLPVGFVRIELDSSPAPRDGHLVLAFSNAPPSEAGAISFTPRATMLLAGAYAPAPNVLRALLVALLKLGILAAAGLLCSAVFSTPVATFAATSLAVMLAAVQYFAFTTSPDQSPFAHHDSGEEAPAWYDRASEAVAHGAAALVAPVETFDTVGAMADGRVVTWATVGKAALTLLVLYTGVPAFVGILLFRRRELAGLST